MGDTVIRLSAHLDLIIFEFRGAGQPAKIESSCVPPNCRNIWARGNVQFASGAYADAKGVKFMYAFNAGGNAFVSTFKYELFDLQGKPIAGCGEGTDKAERITM